MTDLDLPARRTTVDTALSGRLLGAGARMSR